MVERRQSKGKRPRRASLDAHILYQRIEPTDAGWRQLEAALGAALDDRGRAAVVAAANRYVEARLLLDHGAQRAALVGRTDATGERKKTNFTAVGRALKRVRRAWNGGRPKAAALDRALRGLAVAWRRMAENWTPKKATDEACSKAAAAPDPAAPAAPMPDELALKAAALDHAAPWKTMLDELALEAAALSGGALDLAGLENHLTRAAATGAPAAADPRWLAPLRQRAAEIATFGLDAWQELRRRHVEGIVLVREPETAARATASGRPPMIDPFVALVADLAAVAERAGVRASAQGGALRPAGAQGLRVAFPG